MVKSNNISKSKKLILIVLCSFMCIINSACADNNTVSKETLIRIHIRANSNDTNDQDVKLKVRDKINSILEGKLKDVTVFDEAYKIIESLEEELEQESDKVLKINGFKYKTNIKLTNEFFPTRMYEDIVVESGYYDAVIVELGEAKGDNWWCVIYPPLCYVEANGMGEIKYKSKLKELWDRFFG